MTAPVGFERLPRPVRSLVEDAAANALGAANALDALLHGDSTASPAIELAERDGDRIVHDLIGKLGEGRPDGPERERTIAIVQAFGDVLDALEALAWWWNRSPVAALAPFLLGIRDVVRAAASAVRADVPELPARLERLRESKHDGTRLGREARAWLMTTQADPIVAIAGETLLRYGDRALLAAAGLGAAFQRRARISPSGMGNADSTPHRCTT